MRIIISNHAVDLIHALVVSIVVVCATILGLTHTLDRNTIGNVYLAVVGYAAGRAGSNFRTAATRRTDPEPT